MSSLLSCPDCGIHQFYQSGTRNVCETLRYKIFRQQPYRCHSCGCRMWFQCSFEFPEISKKQIIVTSFVIVMAFIVSQILVFGF